MRADARRILMVALGGRDPRDIALVFGPNTSAWQNALHGALWALLFATPWILLFVRSQLSQVLLGLDASYLLWQIVFDLINYCTKWMAFGFFFGYFYPFLLGENGRQKGLWLFAATVLASLPMMLITNSTPEAWQARLFFVLQVFIQCMLLGLVAFDYQVLRQGRYEWRMLFEVYGMTAVGLSVSTILAAVATAATAVITSQATGLVTIALQYFLPPVNTLLPTPGPTPPVHPTATPGP